MRVVLVHWNQPERLAATASAFRASVGVDVRITVVDNGSSPANRAALDGVAEIDEIVDAGANRGFGPGANVGFRRFLEDPDDGEWVALAPHERIKK